MTAMFGGVIRRAVVTERTTAMKQATNQVVFEVDPEATKLQIRSAVETAFKVKVAGVNTMVVRGKVKRMGRFAGKRSNWKKAVVTLKPGFTIETVEGV
jgi:large subunit ribosomal protein L23